MITALNPYMVHDGDPSEGAVLAFARTAREAKRIGFPVIQGWTQGRFTDIRSHRLREHVDYLRTLARGDAPHAFDDVPTCPVCELWGAPLLPDRSGCELCATEVEDQP